MQWYLNRDAALYGGIAATIPFETGPHLRYKFAAIVAAGPSLA
ncbi:hypothetical protein [Spirosoma telluris]